VQTFYLNDGQDSSLPKSEPCVMAMGFFDGVHIAHQQVIQEAKNIAKKREVKLAVMTFFPHPREVLCGGKEKMNYLTPLEVKINKFAQLGVDKLYVIKFDQAFAGLSPKGYIEKYVIGLGAKHVVAGFDFTYGHMGKGTMQTMSMDGDGKFLVTVISKLDYKGQKIGSTFIRNLLSNGEVSKITSYLGAFYETRGEVIVQHQNLMRKSSYMEVATYPYYTLPSNGLYEVEMDVGDHIYQGSALVYSNKIKLQFDGDLNHIKSKTIKLKWMRGLEIESVQLEQI
jgi:riboflavin kinase / FMN adenylyltransferase